ncbi:M50 family metallopeptidase [Saccharopolyspora shandongensis]|uniref:M50 family metallopeptidase n=1 Tax=Saccharopolyspora shandongensis TaxID=418495 RepID=UPI000B87C414|nr:M50 family metallopeptidase [Saccharopolyspora shandongensis]
MDDLVREWSAQLLDSGNVAALIAGVLSLLLVLSRNTWLLLRNVVTIAHEGGHAVVALLSGRKLNGIRLHSDTSGLTVSTGKPTGPGMVFTLLAGYPAVSLLGLGGAWLVTVDLAHVMLWVCIALLAVMLLAIRNAYGVLSIVLTGGVIFAVSWFATPAWQALCCALFSWFLLFGGLRPIAELRRKRTGGRAPNSDADQLARLTGLPAGIWLAIWFLVGLVAVVIGGTWLLLMPQV